MINRIISWIETHLLFSLCFRTCLLFLDDNVDEECEQFSNSKGSFWRCCLAFAWVFGNLSLALLIKMLFIKEACGASWNGHNKYTNQLQQCQSPAKTQYCNHEFNWSVLLIASTILLIKCKIFEAYFIKRTEHSLSSYFNRWWWWWIALVEFLTDK